MTSRAVFLDRDGTLIEHYDYLTDPDQVKLVPFAGAALKQLRDRGFSLVLITNQSAIARGMLTEDKLDEIHNRLKNLLAREGVFLDQIYYCPYHPDGAIEKYRKESELRKPGPGMLLLASSELDIDLSRSWIIGDDDRDVEAGRRVGCRTIQIEISGSKMVRKGQSDPDYTAVNLKEAANLVVRYCDLSVENKAESNFESVAEKNEESLPDPVKATLLNDDSPADASVTKKAKRAGSNNDLLRHILRELQVQNREHRFTEFSIPKLFAGIVQMLVVLCLVMAFLFWSDPEGAVGSVHTCLLLGGVFQMMTLTLLMMHRNQ